MPEAGRCELCGREVPELTRHHLIPRTRHGSKRSRKAFSPEEMRGRIALVCRPWHKTVHATLSEKELEAEYNSLDALPAVGEIRRFVRWVRRQRAGRGIRIRRTRRRR